MDHFQSKTFGHPDTRLLNGSFAVSFSSVRFRSCQIRQGHDNYHYRTHNVLNLGNLGRYYPFLGENLILLQTDPPAIIK